MSTWDQIKKGASSVKDTAVSAGSKGKSYLDKDKSPEPYRRDRDAPRPVFATIATKDVSTFAPPPKRTVSGGIGMTDEAGVAANGDGGGIRNLSSSSHDGYTGRSGSNEPPPPARRQPQPQQQQQQRVLPGRPTTLQQAPSYSSISPPELPRRTSSISPRPMPSRSIPSPQPAPRQASQFTSGLNSLMSGRNALNKMGVSDRQILETSGRMASAAASSSRETTSNNGINTSLKSMMSALPPVAPKPKAAPPAKPPKPVSLSAKPQQPVINTATKPTKSTTTTTTSAQFSMLKEPQPRDIPLDLQDGWFYSQPTRVLPYLADSKAVGAQYSMKGSMASSTDSPGTWVISFIYAIRWTRSLARSWVRVSWSSADPAGTVRAEQRHLGPPALLPIAQLLNQAYGDRLATWAESKLNTQVGDGECWTLADNGLVAIRTPNGPMPSCGLIHGHPIYEKQFTNGLLTTEAKAADSNIRRGDVLQFWKAKFTGRDAATGGVYDATVGSPDHTAIVTSADTDLIHVVEQNSGGVKKVKRSTYRLSEHTNGTFTVFRPVDNSWAGPCEALWDKLEK